MRIFDRRSCVGLFRALERETFLLLRAGLWRRGHAVAPRFSNLIHGSSLRRAAPSLGEAASCRLCLMNGWWLSGAFLHAPCTKLTRQDAASPSGFRYCFARLQPHPRIVASAGHATRVPAMDWRVVCELCARWEGCATTRASSLRRVAVTRDREVEKVERVENGLVPFRDQSSHLSHPSHLSYPSHLSHA